MRARNTETKERYAREADARSRAKRDRKWWIVGLHKEVRFAQATSCASQYEIDRLNQFVQGLE